MKVLLTKEIHSAGVEKLTSKGHQVTLRPLDQFNGDLKDFDAIISMLSDKIDCTLLGENPHLKIIANYAVGHNNIDSKAAKQLGIHVSNTPDVLTNSTAELALSLLFSVSRRIPEAIGNAKDGDWKGWEPMGFIGTHVEKKTVGIVGMGRIGASFAKKLAIGFDCEILYTSRTAKELDFPARHVELEELLRKSEIISIHCPLTEQTNQMISHQQFQMMEKRPILINTARGEVIDQEALVDALNDERIFGAGLDVTSPEPLTKVHPLYHFNNVVITPHIGSADEKSRREMSLLCAENILACFEGRDLVTPV